MASIGGIGDKIRTGFVTEFHIGHDTLYSGKEGEFETRQAAFPIDTVKYNLKINPDENNPYYQADSLKVTFLRKDLQGGEGWNRGNTTQEVKIILTPQKEEDHE